MQPSSHHQTLAFLKRRFAEAGVRPKTRHGQNFLIDLNLLRVLVEAAHLSKDDVVLEIGTGTGALTVQLAERAASVVTVEIDADMRRLAERQLAACENVTLLGRDALKNKNALDRDVLNAVSARMAERPDRPFKLVANLPYHVATPVISNLLALESPPCAMIVTIQKELADRIMARPGTKDYGALSIWVQSQCEVELIRTLPPQAFWPRPKVTSAIIRIILRPELRSRLKDRMFFHGIVRSLFLHRRKFLRSELVSLTKERLDKSDVDALMRQLYLPYDVRAEQLSVAQMIDLSDALREATAGIQ